MVFDFYFCKITFFYVVIVIVLHYFVCQPHPYRLQIIGETCVCPHPVFFQNFYTHSFYKSFYINYLYLFNLLHIPYIFPLQKPLNPTSQKPARKSTPFFSIRKHFFHFSPIFFPFHPPMISIILITNILPSTPIPIK